MPIYLESIRIFGLVLITKQERNREAKKIKREREEEREGSEGTLVGDKVEWVESRPANSQPAKKPRCHPGPGDEVVALDD